MVDRTLNPTSTSSSSSSSAPRHPPAAANLLQILPLPKREAVLWLQSLICCSKTASRFATAKLTLSRMSTRMNLQCCIRLASNLHSERAGLFFSCKSRLNLQFCVGFASNLHSERAGLFFSCKSRFSLQFCVGLAFKPAF